MIIPLCILPLDQIHRNHDNLQHARNSRMIYRHGFLMGVPQKKFDSFIKELQGTMQGKYWGTVFKFLKNNKRINVIDEEENPSNMLNNLQSSWGKYLQLLCVEKPYLDALKKTCLSSIPEFCCFEDLDAADIFDYVFQASQETLTPPNADISDIWNKYFQIEAALSSNLWICDRYMGKNLMDSRNKEMERFLKLLKKSSQNLKRVTIMTGCPQGYNASDIAKSIKDKFAKNCRDISGEVLVTRDNDFGRKYHNRFFRFDCDVIDVGKGMELFRLEKVNYQETIYFSRDYINQYSQIIASIYQVVARGLNDNDPGCCKMKVS